MQGQQPYAPVQRMSREHLSSLLLSPEASKIAVIDVRGDDHVGGHIHTSTHVPSTSLDYRIPQLVRTLADKEIVIFHCALSQERGPRAAREYMDEKKMDKSKREKIAEDRKVSVPVIDPDSGTDSKKMDVLSVEDVDPSTKDQKIYVLDGGFVKWQEKCATPCGCGSCPYMI